MKLKELRESLRRHRQLAARYAAAAKAHAKLATRRKRQIKDRTAAPAKAVAWARSQRGTTESPAGSNKGPKITAWQEAFGSWLVGQPWCGVFVGTALKRAGVKVTGRVAGVVLILEDARLGRNGFKSIVYRRSTGQGRVDAGAPGDAIGMFGESTHVELIQRRVSGGYLTVGGNTSPGTVGSQSNGGGVFERVREDSQVAYIVRPDYPA